MKSITGKLIIAFIFIINAIALGVFAKNENEINALGIFPESVIAATEDTEILRAEFAYMAAKFFQSEEILPSETKFTDVTADNIYSGYIGFLADANIIRGNGENRFLPEKPIKVIEAYKIMIDLLGFSELADLDGSWEVNYLQAANKLGFSKGVAANESGMLTKNAAEKLISNILFTKLPSEQIYVSDGQSHTQYSSDGNRTILAEIFGISVYEGTVGSVDIGENIAKFTVSRNVYDTNPQIFSKGEVIELKPQNGISIYDYENMPVRIWMKDSDELVYIGFSGDVEVKYGYILSVNGDSDKNAKYDTEYIERITIENDRTEYRVADDVVMMMNRSAVNAPVALAQHFAKIVIINGKVAYIESWELKEGGIITGVRGGEIQFTKGERINVTIDDYDKCTDRLVFIGGRRADEAEIKTDSLFYYYVKEDFSIIVVSEKIITDEFVGKSYDGINIGGSFYESDDVYYSEDGKTYKLNRNMEKLYGLIVSAYIAPNGKVLYVKPESGQLNTSEFIGVVYGVSDADPFSDDRKIALWSLAGENPEKVMYTINSKTKYEDSITVDILRQNAKKYDGSGVFKFTVNGRGNVINVAELSPFYGFGTGRVKTTTTYLHGANRAYLNVNGKRLYFDKSKITVIYNDNGEFSVKQITWADIRERTSSTGFTFEFFGEELESIPSLVLMTGDVDTIGSAGVQAGFVTGRSKTTDEEGNIAYILDVHDKNGKTEYIVSEELSNRIPERALLLFNHSLKFSNNGINLWAVADLSGNFMDWTLNECNVANSWVSHGVVEKYDGIRLYLDDGTAEFVNNNPSVSYFEPSAREPFVFGKTQYDVNPGDKVFYIVYDGTITDIVCLKD